MSTNKYMITEYLAKGKELEAQFSNALLLSEGGQLLSVSQNDDIKKHIDVRWHPVNKSKPCTFDVKGLKKNNRSDTNLSYNKTWLEFKNVNGEPGSLYGKQDYFAFELKDEWAIVRREELLKNTLNNIKDNTIYTVNPYQDFLYYQRNGRQDKIVRVPISFIIENARKIIPKII